MSDLFVFVSACPEGFCLGARTHAHTHAQVGLYTLRKFEDEIKTSCSSRLSGSVS